MLDGPAVSPRMNSLTKCARLDIDLSIVASLWFSSSMFDLKMRVSSETDFPAVATTFRKWIKIRRVVEVSTILGASQFLSQGIRIVENLPEWTALFISKRRFGFPLMNLGCRNSHHGLSTDDRSDFTLRKPSTILWNAGWDTICDHRNEYHTMSIRFESSNLQKFSWRTKLEKLLCL